MAPDPARTSRLRLAALGAGSAVAFVVVALLVRADWTPLTHFDLRIAEDLHKNAVDHPGQVRLWRDISDVFAPTVLRIAAVVAAVLLLARARDLWAPLVLAASVLGTMFLSPLTKLLVNRDRPHFANPVAHAAGQSYPSGHALTSFVAVVAVLVVCSPRARRFAAAPGVIVVVAVGFSRMILGVHYLSDVVGGWLLGTAWICVVLLVLRHSRFAARVRA